MPGMLVMDVAVEVKTGIMISSLAAGTPEGLQLVPVFHEPPAVFVHVFVAAFVLNWHSAIMHSMTKKGRLCEMRFKFDTLSFIYFCSALLPNVNNFVTKQSGIVTKPDI